MPAPETPDYIMDALQRAVLAGYKPLMWKFTEAMWWDVAELFRLPGVSLQVEQLPADVTGGAPYLLCEDQKVVYL